MKLFFKSPWCFSFEGVAEPNVGLSFFEIRLPLGLSSMPPDSSSDSSISSRRE